jgi:hypothetical protein
MRTRTPFALSPIMQEKQVRLLYAAIDGRRTLAELASMMGLETSTVADTLRTLLNKNCIQMYDSAGKLVEITL